MLLIHWAYIYEKCIKIRIYIIRIEKMKKSMYILFIKIIMFEMYNWYIQKKIINDILVFSVWLFWYKLNSFDILKTFERNCEVTKA